MRTQTGQSDGEWIAEVGVHGGSSQLIHPPYCSVSDRQCLPLFVLRIFHWWGVENLFVKVRTTIYFRSKVQVRGEEKCLFEEPPHLSSHRERPFFNILFKEFLRCGKDWNIAQIYTFFDANKWLKMCDMTSKKAMLIECTSTSMAWKLDFLFVYVTGKRTAYEVFYRVNYNRLGNQPLIWIILDDSIIVQ